ncbi:MAG TPA: TIGR01777 family oxidoreductase [Arthrobacter sp.]
MRIVIAGASGLIGTHLSTVLRHAGHEVVTLVRRAPSSAAEIGWDPLARRLDPASLAGAGAVINLSGAGIGDRPWTRRRIGELFRSRLDATGTLTQAMHRLDVPPPTFISQSASGYYGDAGSTVLGEGTKAGTGVLSRLCVEWEAAAHTAPTGVRVVTPRTGVVFSRSGGALGRLLPLLRCGVGGPLGHGRQYWPWVTLPDVSSAFQFLIESQHTGPVNVCAPESADVNSLVSALAAALHRPAILRVPAPVLRLVLGKLADELLLPSQRMDPVILADAGFDWEHASVARAAEWIAS